MDMLTFLLLAVLRILLLRLRRRFNGHRRAHKYCMRAMRHPFSRKAQYSSQIAQNVV